MEKEDPGEKKPSPIAPPTSYIHTTSEHGARRHDALLAAGLFFNAQLACCWSRLVGISGYGCDGSVLRRRLARFRKTDTVLLSHFPFCLSVCLSVCQPAYVSNAHSATLRFSDVKSLASN